MRRCLIASWRALFALFAFFAATAGAQTTEVAMVTLLSGSVERVVQAGKQPVQAFTKLRRGDLLAIAKDARVQVVYFESGRQETWTGSGRLEIGSGAGVPFGLPAPEIKVLPTIMVRQIAKTASLDSQERGGMMRLRSIAGPGDVEKIEENYKRLRAETARNDLNPELYLYSALFELREYDRLDQALAALPQQHPGNPEARATLDHYRKLLRDAPGLQEPAK